LEQVYAYDTRSEKHQIKQRLFFKEKMYLNCGAQRLYLNLPTDTNAFTKC